MNEFTNGQLISEVTPSGYGKVTVEAAEALKEKIAEQNDPRVFAISTRCPKGNPGLLLYFRTDLHHDVEHLLGFKFGTKEEKTRYTVKQYNTAAISGKNYRYHLVQIEDKTKPVVSNLRPVIESLFATLRKTKTKTHKAQVWGFE